MNLIAPFYEDHGVSSTCATYLICTYVVILKKNACRGTYVLYFCGLAVDMTSRNKLVVKDLKSFAGRFVEPSITFTIPLVCKRLYLYQEFYSLITLSPWKLLCLFSRSRTNPLLS